MCQCCEEFLEYERIMDALIAEKLPKLMAQPFDYAVLYGHARRDFIPDDPTEDPNFDPSKWTGTILSSVLKSRAECGGCGAEWTDGHECRRLNLEIGITP